MAVRIGVPRERATGETRVATVPAVAEKFAALGAEVLLERGAGALSHVRDEEYTTVTLVDDPAEVFAADVVLKVDPPTPAEVGLMSRGTVLIGLLQPYTATESVAALRDGGITGLALELLPRTTRAQSMDALTSQASIAGYKAGLMAASLAGRYYPMLMTPAGHLHRRQDAAFVLGMMKDPQAVEPLCLALHNPDPLLRLIVVEALGKIGDAAAADALRRATGDVDRSVAAAAHKSLKKMGMLPREG